MNPLGLGPEATAAIAASVVVVIGGLVALVRYTRPKVQAIGADVVRARDALIGRDAVHDSITGRELSRALPGIGVRMEHSETQIDILVANQGEMTSAIKQLVDQSKVIEDHETRLTKLEAASVERIVGRAESAQAWSAMEAAIHATPGDIDAEPSDVVEAETTEEQP